MEDLPLNLRISIMKKMSTPIISKNSYLKKDCPKLAKEKKKQNSTRNVSNGGYED